MNILIIGGGGREHALAWKIKQSPRVKKIFVAPGNAGTEKISENIDLNTATEIVNWAKEHHIDLVVVGPDSYLAEGLVNTLQELGIKVFGPTKEAAEIEWSKVFAKEFMQKENIPTAKYKAFKDWVSAKEYIQSQKFPAVIKASGLALGKGVVIAQTLEEAEKAIEMMMSDKVFGDAGSEVVIEEYLVGLEISTHAFCDGEHVIMFPASQDRKRIFENDEGPNTGGMGTIAPIPEVTKDQLEEIKHTIVIPAVRGLKKMGRPFKGILFPGVMLTNEGPKVIEFNARFGDPETQSYMRILETDLLDILLSCVDGTLGTQEVKWSNKTACCIVLASKGYPGSYEKGKMIEGLETMKSDHVEVFHAGTKNEKGNIVTSGGRVLGVSSTGNTLKESLANAYRGVSQIHFEGKQYRSDIGIQSIGRK